MKISEIYESIQGEGPNVGVPCTFVRFGGCNLRCPGWGQGKLPDGTLVNGCDTVFAVFPEWRDYWDDYTKEDLVEELGYTTELVCLTGGEPLLQRTSDINYVAEWLLDELYRKIDVFTNGTRLLKNYPWTADTSVTVVMDYKLEGSGEGGSFELENLEYLGQKDAIKFVCRDRRDFDEALRAIKTYQITVPQVYFAPVWDYLDPASIATWVRDDIPTAKVNIQTHKYIWEPNARRV